MSRIADINLAPEGEKKIEWARRSMPVLNAITEELEREQPFAGMRVALAVHVEAKTACLCRALARGGAEMYVTGCNPLSTQDDVAAALAAGGLQVFASHGVSDEEYENDLRSVLSVGPSLIIDDGGDLTALMHAEFASLLPGVIGGCEETTTGIHRLRMMAREGALRYPVVTVNDADCKYLFDNRYGSGQSVWDGIMRTTNLVVAGKQVVVAGYGWCGKGVAMRAKGMGARVLVTEVDPVKAIEAHMDGFEVLPMAQAAPRGDLFVTVTGCENVITAEHFAMMKDGAVLSNAGHFNVEIDTNALRACAESVYCARKNVEGFVMPDGRTLFLLAEGRLVNLAAGDGHPVEIMDMSFALQAMSARYLAQSGGSIAPGVVPVPREIDPSVARKKLETLGISIDRLTPEQEAYLGI